MEPSETEEQEKHFLIFERWIKKNIVSIIFIVSLFAIVASVIVIKNELVWQFGSNKNSSDDSSVSQNTEEKNNCNVLGIELHGEVVTYISPADYDTDGNITVDQTASENVAATITTAENDENIKAILLEVDSYGGSPVGAEEINGALKGASKPTVVLIRSAGTSAAYWSAVGGDIIFASKNSDIGGIGVTMSYLDYSKQNQKEGFTYNQLISGKFKDAGNPDRPLSVEERNLLMRDVNIIHQNFIKTVAEDRNLDIKKVTALADGSTMLGEMALANGLIDKIGGLSEVKQYLKEKIGQDPEICW